MKKLKIERERITYRDMRELLDGNSKMFGDKIAFSYRLNPHSDKIKKSFNELNKEVKALASAFLAKGYAKKHIALIGKLSYNWILVYYATMAIGSTLVPLDRDWLANDLVDTVRKADVSVLICDSDISEKSDFIAKSCLIRDFYETDTDSENSINALLESGAKEFENNKDAYYKCEINPDELSLLVFTSGTTGKGKGVMLSQTNIISDISSIIVHISDTEKSIAVLPPHHTYGSSVNIVAHNMMGAETYISQGLRYIQKEMKEEKPTHLILVPLFIETFYRKIMATLKEQKKDKLIKFLIKVSNLLRHIGIDLRHKLFKPVVSAFGGRVRYIISGGAPINSDILEFFESLGLTMLNGYGITECSPIVAVNTNTFVTKGSVGPVLDIDTVRIDKPNSLGEGEILVKGPNVMLGYYKDEEATAEAFTKDGFFRTGDYGKLNKDNVLFITGRKKNLIILSNGKNVYPEEIESEFVSVPGVIDTVVYEGESKRGMMHNAIVAEIYPDYEFMETNGITDIKKYLQGFVDTYNKSAVAYKKIAVLKVRETEFPKNTLRKILRFKLDRTID